MVALSEFISIFFQKTLNWRRINAIEQLKEQNCISESGVIRVGRLEYTDWVRDTAELIKKYVGESSSYYSDLIKMKIIQTPLAQEPTIYDLKNETVRINEAASLVAGCIIYLAKGGDMVQKEVFFCTWPMGAKVSFLIFAIGILFAAGKLHESLTNTYKADFNEINAKYETVIHERDSIQSLLNTRPPGVPTLPIKGSTDSTNKENDVKK